MKGIGTGVPQPGFKIEEWSSNKGSSGINWIKGKYLSAKRFQNFSPACDFHQIAVAKTSVFKFWNFLFCTLCLKSDMLQYSQKAFALFFLSSWDIMRLRCNHRGCISHPYSCLELDPWKDYSSRSVRTDMAELCGEARWIMRQSNRENKRPKWQLVSTLFEKEPYCWFSIGSKLNVSALFNKMKYFVSGQTNESKRFFWQNWFWWTFLVLWGFVGFWFFSFPPAPCTIFQQ